MTEQKIVNGVNVEQMFDTINAITETPTLGSFNFRASNRWINGSHNRTTIKDFYGAGHEDTSRQTAFVMDNDEPAVLLGGDKGANPVEVVLHALAGCLTTSLVFLAAAQGIQLDEVESELEGDVDLRGFLGLAEDVRNGYKNIRVTFRIKADVPNEKLEELCQLAQQRSPVFDIITNPVPVSVKLSNQYEVPGFDLPGTVQANNTAT
jgi:uncharacterized OsmC-like protein